MGMGINFYGEQAIVSSERRERERVQWQELFNDILKLVLFEVRSK